MIITQWIFLVLMLFIKNMKYYYCSNSQYWQLLLTILYVECMKWEYDLNSYPVLLVKCIWFQVENFQPARQNRNLIQNFGNWDHNIQFCDLTGFFTFIKMALVKYFLYLMTKYKPYSTYNWQCVKSQAFQSFWNCVKANKNFVLTDFK